jgi:hypothetical protein
MRPLLLQGCIRVVTVVGEYLVVSEVSSMSSPAVSQSSSPVHGRAKKLQSDEPRDCCGGRTESSTMAVARGWASWALRGHVLDARWQQVLGRKRKIPSAHYYYHKGREHAILCLAQSLLFITCTSVLALICLSARYHLLRDSLQLQHEILVHTALHHCNHVIHVCFKMKGRQLLISTIKNYMTLLSLPLAPLAVHPSINI